MKTRVSPESIRSSYAEEVQESTDRDRERRTRAVSQVAEQIASGEDFSVEDFVFVLSNGQLTGNREVARDLRILSRSAGRLVGLAMFERISVLGYAAENPLEMRVRQTGETWSASAWLKFSHASVPWVDRGGSHYYTDYADQVIGGSQARPLDGTILSTPLVMTRDLLLDPSTDLDAHITKANLDAGEAHEFLIEYARVSSFLLGQLVDPASLNQQT